MDQHKESIEIATADEGRDGEVRRYGLIDGELDSFERVVRKLVASGKELRFVYEAGPSCETCSRGSCPTIGSTSVEKPG